MVNMQLFCSLSFFECFQIENVSYVQAPASRVGNNILISPPNPTVVRHKPVPVTQPDYESGADVSYEDYSQPEYQHYSPMVNTITQFYELLFME